jgi:hypothetical protein
MKSEVLVHMAERERAKIGRDVLNIFAEESDGVLGPAGALYEFERFDSHPNFAPFNAYEGVVFAWGRRHTEAGWAVTGVPMLLSWATDFKVDEVRAAARAIRDNWEKVLSDSAALQERYLRAYCLVQVETLLGTFPHFDALPAIRYCKVCAEQGRSSAARKLMPLSSDKGQTVQLVGTCDLHAADWWKDADWDGRHLVWTRAGQ